MEENMIIVDELEEAKFIQKYLKEAGVDIDLDTILLVTEGQLMYMEEIGLIEEYKG